MPPAELVGSASQVTWTGGVSIDVRSSQYNEPDALALSPPKLLLNAMRGLLILHQGDVVKDMLSHLVDSFGVQCCKSPVGKYTGSNTQACILEYEPQQESVFITRSQNADLNSQNIEIAELICALQFELSTTHLCGELAESYCS